MTDRLTCDATDCGQPIPNGEAVVRSRNFEQRTYHRACAERAQRVPEQRTGDQVPDMTKAAADPEVSGGDVSEVRATGAAGPAA